MWTTKKNSRGQLDGCLLDGPPQRTPPGSGSRFALSLRWCHCRNSRGEAKFLKKQHTHTRAHAALTSLVSTMPLTYLPTAGSTQRTPDSSARYTSLSATRASIFRSPPLPLVCSPGSRESLCLSGSAHGGSVRGWEVGLGEEGGACTLDPFSARRSHREGGGGCESARPVFRSCLENATRPHHYKKLNK